MSSRVIWQRIFPMINRRINAPFPYWHFMKTPADRALEESLAFVHRAIRGYIANSRARLANDPELVAHPTNFLEAMLATRETEGSEFTDEEISGNVLDDVAGRGRLDRRDDGLDVSFPDGASRHPGARRRRKWTRCWAKATC